MQPGGNKDEDDARDNGPSHYVLTRQRQVLVAAVWSLNYESPCMTGAARELFDVLGCLHHQVGTAVPP